LDLLGRVVPVDIRRRVHPEDPRLKPLRAGGLLGKADAIKVAVHHHAGKRGERAGKFEPGAWGDGFLVGLGV